LSHFTSNYFVLLLNTSLGAGKMLVKDKFPYGDYGELTVEDMEEGKRNLDKFVFIGMNEM
jgi:hypothetical protein